MSFKEQAPKNYNGILLFQLGYYSNKQEHSPESYLHPEQWRSLMC